MHRRDSIKRRSKGCVPLAQHFATDRLMLIAQEKRAAGRVGLRANVFWQPST